MKDVEWLERKRCFTSTERHLEVQTRGRVKVRLNRSVGRWCRFSTATSVFTVEWQVEAETCLLSVYNLFRVVRNQCRVLYMYCSAGPGSGLGVQCVRCVRPPAGPQGAAGHPERLLPGHVHSRHEGEGPGQDPHEGADSCRVRPHSPVHVLRLAGAQHADGPRDPPGNSTRPRMSSLRWFSQHYCSSISALTGGKVIQKSSWSSILYIFLSWQAAMYVQLTEAVEFCCSFLLAKICLENCAEVMRLLEDFSVGVEGVQEQLDNFLLDNFVPLMSRPDFLSYLGLERLQVRLFCIIDGAVCLQKSWNCKNKLNYLKPQWLFFSSSPGVPEQWRSESLPRNWAVRSCPGVAATRPAALEAHRHHRAVHPLLPHDSCKHLWEGELCFLCSNTVLQAQVHWRCRWSALLLLLFFFITGEDVRVLPLLQTAEAGGRSGAQLLPWCQPAASGGDALQPYPLRPPTDGRLQGNDWSQYGQQQDPAAAAPKGVCLFSASTFSLTCVWVSEPLSEEGGNTDDVISLNCSYRWRITQVF